MHQTINLVLWHSSCEHVHCLSKWWACWLPLKPIKVADGSATSKPKKLQLGRKKFCRIICLLYVLFLCSRERCAPQEASLGSIVHALALQTASLNYTALAKLQGYLQCNEEFCPLKRSCSSSRIQKFANVKGKGLRKLSDSSSDMGSILPLCTCDR